MSHITTCRKCHNELHANESLFNKNNGLDEIKWLDHIIGNLTCYVESLNVNSQWVILEALRAAAERSE